MLTRSLPRAGRSEAATGVAGRGRRTEVAEAFDDTRWWRRLRSAVLLVAMLVVLGVAVAAGIGATVVLLVSLLDQALA